MPVIDDEADDAMDDALTADDTPAYVNEGTEDDDIVVQGEDISAAEPISHDDVIDGAKGVVFIIKKAVVDTYTPQRDNPQQQWMKRSLKLQIAIGPAGVDGKGRYKNKTFFPRPLIAVNRQYFPVAFSKEWYAPKTGGAWGEYNELLKALGFNTAPAPNNNKAFRQGLVGRSFIADILKVHPRRPDTNGKYVTVKDEWENLVEGMRPIGATAGMATTTAAATGMTAIAEE